MVKITNLSNYPKIVYGVRIQPDEQEEVELGPEQLEGLRDDGKLEIEDESAPSEKGENVYDTEETSKPQEKNEEEGDE